MSREFDLGDILSITEGSMVAPRGIEAIYDILNYMTGESLFTHALPRAADACEPTLLEQHPDLAEIQAPTWDRVEGAIPIEDQVSNWLDEMKAIYGETRTVEPLGSWEPINPTTELLQMIGPERVIVVEV